MQQRTLVPTVPSRSHPIGNPILSEHEDLEEEDLSDASDQAQQVAFELGVLQEHEQLEEGEVEEASFESDPIDGEELAQYALSPSSRHEDDWAVHNEDLARRVNRIEEGDPQAANNV